MLIWKTRATRSIRKRPAHPIWGFGFTISMAIAGSCHSKGESDLTLRHFRFAELTPVVRLAHSRTTSGFLNLSPCKAIEAVVTDTFASSATSSAATQISSSCDEMHDFLIQEQMTRLQRELMNRDEDSRIVLVRKRRDRAKGVAKIASLTSGCSNTLCSVSKSQQAFTVSKVPSGFPCLYTFSILVKFNEI